MRILHVNNIANVALTLREALKKIGVNAQVAAVHNIYSNKVDISFLSSSTTFANMKLFFWIIKNIKNYDIIHYHGGLGPTAYYYNFKRRSLPPFLLHFHGSDLRDQKRFHSIDFAEKIIVSTPDLLKYCYKLKRDDLLYLPNPIILENYRSIDIVKRAREVEEGRPTRIVHLPSSRRIKGTETLVKAVKRIRSKGFKINLDIVEGVTPSEALKRLKMADIVVDWISPNYSIYGLVSIQAMALSIPVVCHIDPDLYPEKPPLLAVKPTVNGVASGIERIVEKPSNWIKYGRAERRYIERNHDAHIISENLKTLYEEMM